MKHRTDCPWVVQPDLDGCTCAEQAYLESCSAQEREDYERRSQPRLAMALDVARVSWAGTTRRTA